MEREREGDGGRDRRTKEKERGEKSAYMKEKTGSECVSSSVICFTFQSSLKIH